MEDKKLPKTTILQLLVASLNLIIDCIYVNRKNFLTIFWIFSSFPVLPRVPLALHSPSTWIINFKIIWIKRKEEEKIMNLHFFIIYFFHFFFFTFFSERIYYKFSVFRRSKENDKFVYFIQSNKIFTRFLFFTRVRGTVKFFHVKELKEFCDSCKSKPRTWQVVWHQAKRKKKKRRNQMKVR